MKYRKTFREALNDVEKKDKPEAKPEVKPEVNPEVQGLKDEIQRLKLELENEKNKVVKPEPNPETGEVPLRTGIAAALLDKNGPKPDIEKQSNEKKLKLKSGKTKIEVNPNVDIGQISGGNKASTGNLH